MRRLRRLPARLTRPLRRALPLLALVLACRSTAEPAAPLRLQLVTPVRPLGVPGWPLLDTLTVQVLDDAGRARGGKLVT